MHEHMVKVKEKRGKMKREVRTILTNINNNSLVNFIEMLSWININLMFGLWDEGWEGNK